MATRAQNFKVDEDRKKAAAHDPRRKKIALHKGHSKGKRHPSEAGERKAAYAWEESNAKSPSRKSTRKGSQHQRPDVGLGKRQRARTAAPKARATRALAGKS